MRHLPLALAVATLLAACQPAPQPPKAAELEATLEAD